MTDTCTYQAETEYGFIEVCDQEEEHHPDYVPDGFDEHDFTLSDKPDVQWLWSQHPTNQTNPPNTAGFLFKFFYSKLMPNPLDMGCEWV